MDCVSFDKLGFRSAVDSQTLRPSMLIFNNTNNLSIIGSSMYNNEYVWMVKWSTKINMFCALGDFYATFCTLHDSVINPNKCYSRHYVHITMLMTQNVALGKLYILCLFILLIDPFHVNRGSLHIIKFFFVTYQTHWKATRGAQIVTIGIPKICLYS